MYLYESDETKVHFVAYDDKRDRRYFTLFIYRYQCVVYTILFFQPVKIRFSVKMKVVIFSGKRVMNVNLSKVCRQSISFLEFIFVKGTRW